MPIDINDDVAQAIKNLWMATPGLGTARASDGFSAGELKASLPSPQPSTYALIEVSKGKENQRYTGDGFMDFRNVTLTIRGLKGDAVKALALMLSTFNRRLVSSDVAQPLAIPQAVTLAAVAGGVLPPGPYSYLVTAVNALGESLPSQEAIIATPGPGAVQVTWQPVQRAAWYNVYGRVQGVEQRLISVTSPSWVDVGTIMLGNGNPPQSDTTARPSLTMPSGARFVRWWPMNDGDKSIEDTPKSGNEIWKAWIAGEVWTIRTEGDALSGAPLQNLASTTTLTSQLLS